MRPVISTKTALIEKLVRDKPMLLLNKTRFSFSFICSIVYQSPNLISTREGKKTLPMELWLMIIDFALQDENEDDFTLARPRDLQPSTDGADHEGQVLICDEYEHHTECNGLAVDEVLTEFLKDPDTTKGVAQVRDSLPSLTGHTFAVNLNLLSEDSKPEFLYWDLEIPDIISWLKYGSCWLCGGARELCPGCGTWADHILAERFRCGYDVACPICIGTNYAGEYFSLLHTMDTDGEEVTEEEWDELETEVTERKKQLGYLV